MFSRNRTVEDIRKNVGTVYDETGALAEVG